MTLSSLSRVERGYNAVLVVFSYVLVCTSLLPDRECPRAQAGQDEGGINKKR
jgi:hypothetical protein